MDCPCLQNAGIPNGFVQNNHCWSVNNTLRGLHYKIQYPQRKLLKCTRGEAFDVAVDLGKASPSFDPWVAEILPNKFSISFGLPQTWRKDF
ncbi:hypothetical protein D4A39_11895 [Alcanivorax profundi]|uniref:dTDP-4-dehydrorhamnose 3,5-epimerase n=1 Tax=Alcanivorax profundi TaxID=2338368 RepID=A0A418XX81_9GAMM|nr:hypothetical protein D4A39_11895 [Alcanivorax profundi]